MKKISYEEWMKEGEKRFGEDMKNWKFVCPNCGNIQSFHDFKKLELGDEKIRGIVYFSCIGRWTENCKGTIRNKKSPCNYTCGGLFDFSKLKVEKKGKEISVFEFAEGKKK